MLPYPVQRIQTSYRPMPTESTYILTVTAPHFCASSLWRKDGDGELFCYQAAPIIAWMQGKRPKWLEAYLKGKGWHYGWREMKDEINILSELP